MYTYGKMDLQPYIPGLSPAEPGPLSRFIPPLEEGVISSWLPLHAPAGSWLLDPFGFSPQLVLEAARAGYRVLVTVNNPITRFLLEMGQPLQNQISSLRGRSICCKKRRRETRHTFSITISYKL